MAGTHHGVGFLLRQVDQVDSKWCLLPCPACLWEAFKQFRRVLLYRTLRHGRDLTSILRWLTLVLRDVECRSILLKLVGSDEQVWYRDLK